MKAQALRMSCGCSLQAEQANSCEHYRWRFSKSAVICG
jgi:hypothetical protein